MHPSAFLTWVDNSSDVFVTNTSFFYFRKVFQMYDWTFLIWQTRDV